ncbi:hypothetical protein DEU56DRAFT_902238 [Suillus clintonianus]|uniref:uncharacterized protein n=1 Tax=Suillus clintonianus TaxID=1904413 RepID=UPI001B879BFD|nr:uncharacterized protein DEU56DRAFT_902238 [Suillus clintonianus]KAG2132972.1 hypothetical protein DEU56DRAFT_902238 [Suillus clintonianus]
MSLAYTMFNVYLPKLLETGSSDDTSTKSLEASLWDVLIITMGGCPGAILGAYTVESPLGFQTPTISEQPRLQLMPRKVFRSKVEHSTSPIHALPHDTVNFPADLKNV